MTTIRLKLTALIFSYSAFLFSQDLTGIWQGVSSKNEIPRTYYVLTLTLQQTGANVTGNGITKTPNDPSYVNQSVKGTVNGNVLTFADQAVLDSLSTFYWCMRYGNLKYDPALEKLYGDDIQTTNCQPFIIKMELYRLKIYADTNVCTAKNVDIRATGQNLRWYKDSTKRTLLTIGSSISPFVTQDTTFYVTQSLYDVESPVVPVTIHFKGYTKNQSIKLCEGQSGCITNSYAAILC
jgi:Ig-like domain CHU_C associated